MTSPACVVGLGYVGLPLAVALAESGVEVVGYDVNPLRIAGLRAGRSGIEDVPDTAVTAPGLRFTDDAGDLAACQTYVLCVPTPLREGMPDLGAVESASRTVASVLRAGDLVVLESTTYPGTTEEVVGPLLDAGLGLVAESGLVTTTVDVRARCAPQIVDRSANAEAALPVGTA